MSRNVFNIAPLFRRAEEGSNERKPKKKKNKYVKSFKRGYLRANQLHLQSSRTGDSGETISQLFAQQRDSQPSPFFDSSLAPTASSTKACLQAVFSHLRSLSRTTPPLCHIRLVTTHGNLNVELYPGSAPRTVHTFLRLCSEGGYDDCPFHRLIPSFMLQGGRGIPDHLHVPDFEDEFDTRLCHDSRGVVSMANRGPNTNSSQFFVTFGPCRHLDHKHSVFGRVVGGLGTLDRIEQVETGENDVPLERVAIVRVVVYNDVFPGLIERWHREGLAEGETEVIDEEIEEQ